MKNYTYEIYRIPRGEGIGWRGWVTVNGAAEYTTEVWWYKRDATDDCRRHIRNLKAIEKREVLS